MDFNGTVMTPDKPDYLEKHSRNKQFFPNPVLPRNQQVFILPECSKFIFYSLIKQKNASEMTFLPKKQELFYINQDIFCEKLLYVTYLH